MKKLVLTVAVLIVANFLFAQEVSDITPRDIAKLQYVTSARINDEGNKIVYSVSVPADPTRENKPSSAELYLMDVTTGNSVPFITQGSISGVAFRPGHNTLTFISKRDEDKLSALYEISLAGGEAQKIFEHSTSIYGYDWSPDGKKIAFTAKEKKQKEEDALPYQPEVYEENLINTRAYVAEIGKEEATEIKAKGHFHSIKWGPKGQKLAAVVAPTSLVDDAYMKKSIYIFKSADLSKTAEIKQNAKLGMFVWNPNGKQLALQAGADINDPKEGRLLIADVQTGTFKNLSPDFLGMFDYIAWADEKTVQFIASESAYSTLGKINVGNGEMVKTIDKGNIAFTRFSLAKNGTMALVGSTAQYPNELHSIKSGAAPVRMTTTNPWLAEKSMGKQEVITYKARDGLELQGVLIRPVNESKGKKYPLITVVHGGPEAHMDHGWNTYYSRPGHMAAAKGYALFYPNYRGSTGRGVEFAKSSQGDPAGKEFDDIVDGIDYLISTGLVDKDKVGVTGGSYGGYATGWFATKYSERFAAGVMFVGISNTLSSWGTGDIPNEHYYIHYLKHLWEDYEFFLKRSPIYYADQAKTPLLIMAGKGDTRVDPGQSYELYRHIKTRTETPVRLVLYPGEGHGNRKATARYDYSLRMMRWFDTFLMNEADKIPENKIEDWQK